MMGAGTALLCVLAIAAVFYCAATIGIARMRGGR
jgi:hypothetical protein